jgi:hypothetical protein
MTAAWSLKNAIRGLAQGWHEFFHAPCDARVCAAVRIAFASLVLIHLAVLYPDLDLWFTDAGLLPLENARQFGSAFSWSVFWLLPSTSTVMQTCFWIMVAHTVMLIIGLLARVNAAALFVWLVSLQARNTVINDGEDTVMRMICFFLIWMPIGQCWSLNAVIRRFWTTTATNVAPGWGLRLLQIQMAVILLSTGLVKLQGETWLNGTALYYVSRLDDFFGRFPVPAWLFDTPWIVAWLTWSVIFVEVAAPIFIWFRETRRVCLVAIILFHLASDWSMHLFLFHWLMLAGWISFVSADDFRWLFGWRNSQTIGT